MSERVWTVLELLRWTAGHFESKGIESARLDAECLLAHALDCERLRLYLEFDKPVEEDERARFRDLVRRRAEERVPVAYLTGGREFWSLPLVVEPGVLVPRPETETLVSAALELFPDPEAEIDVLDLGTGTGAVALALASERPKARVTATDVSTRALGLAARNAEALGLADRVRLLAGDLFEPVAGERFDLVVSNPPYVGEGERAQLAPELAHEPGEALFAGPEGTDVLLRIAAELDEAVAEGGAVAVEIGAGQEGVVRQAFEASGFGPTALHRDLAGRPRVITSRRRAARSGGI